MKATKFETAQNKVAARFVWLVRENKKDDTFLDEAILRGSRQHWEAQKRKDDHQYETKMAEIAWILNEIFKMSPNDIAALRKKAEAE